MPPFLGQMRLFPGQKNLPGFMVPPVRPTRRSFFRDSCRVRVRVRADASLSRADAFLSWADASPWLYGTVRPTVLT